MDFLLTTYPPLFVHVHIERPLVEKQEKGGEKKKQYEKEGILMSNDKIKRMPKYW